MVMRDQPAAIGLALVEERILRLHPTRFSVRAEQRERAETYIPRRVAVDLEHAAVDCASRDLHRAEARTDPLIFIGRNLERDAELKACPA